MSRTRPFIVLLTFAVFGSTPVVVVEATTTFALSGLTQNYNETDEAWAEIFAKAKDLGVQNLHLQAGTWQEIESTEGSFILSYLDGFLKAMMKEENQDFSYSLDVATPLGIGGPKVPPHVNFTTWDSAEMFAQYKGYLDAVFAILPHPTYVMLHTESAGYYFTEEQQHQEELAAFQTLLNNTSKYIKSILPAAAAAKIGVYGGKPESAETLRQLNLDTDYFGLTYIADRGDEDFEFQLRQLLERAPPDKPIAIVEAGVPTHERVGGSDVRQQAYVETLFQLAREYGDRMEYISYYQALDEEEWVTRSYVPILFPDWTGDTFEDAVKWFSSLGLYRADGEPKPAVATFQSELSLYMNKNISGGDAPCPSYCMTFVLLLGLVLAGDMSLFV